MILLDVAPLWVPFAFAAGQFLIVIGAGLGIILLAEKLIKKAISKNKEKNIISKDEVALIAPSAYSLINLPAIMASTVLYALESTAEPIRGSVYNIKLRQIFPSVRSLVTFMKSSP